jgi:hypothetical protein
MALITSNSLLLPEPQVLQTEVVEGTLAARSLWQSWLRVPGGDDPGALRARADHFEEHVSELADAVEKVHGAANSKLVDQEDRWSPLAAEVATWCTMARSAVAGS